MERRQLDDPTVDYDELLRRLALLGGEPGEQYSLLRTRLVRIAEQWGSRAPEDLADETLSRVARKLGQGTEVRDLPHYVVGIARNVFHEMLRSQQKGFQFVGNIDALEDLATEPVDDSKSEIVDRLTECMGHLSEEDRETMLTYYDEDGASKVEFRQRLAKSLGMSRNALTVRMFRLRQRLERCLSKQGKPSS